MLATGPLSILPLGIITFLLFGTYDSGEIGHLQSIPLFLQGSTDMGGSDLFAATMASYVVFGFTGAIYLTLRLSAAPQAGSFQRTLGRSVWYLKYHIATFAYAGFSPVSYYDSRILPNDFRNMFLLAALVYASSAVLIIWLHRLELDLRLRLTLAPLLILLWLIIGSDGTTAKAGQVLYAGENPQTAPRGLRHGLMLEWHRICDVLLGDVR